MPFVLKLLLVPSLIFSIVHARIAARSGAG